MEHSESISDELARLAEQTDDDELRDDIQNLATVASSLGPEPVPLVKAGGVVGYSDVAQRQAELPEVVQGDTALIAPVNTLGAEKIQSEWETSVYEPNSYNYDNLWRRYCDGIEESDVTLECVLSLIDAPELFCAPRGCPFPEYWQDMDDVCCTDSLSHHWLIVPVSAESYTEATNRWAGKTISRGESRTTITWEDAWRAYREQTV
jgi:hypothetical protein